MKKTFLIATLLFVLVSNSFAQTSPKIQRAYAYYSLIMPGMIMQDDKGNPVNPGPTIDRVIYIECPGTKMPDVKSVLYNGIAYTPGVSAVTGAKVQVGKRSDNSKDIVLTAAKGNSFWKLDLLLSDDKTKGPRDVKKITIQGKANKKAYNFHLYTEVQLFTADRP